MQPRLIVEQKITAFVNKYRIYAAADGGGKGELCAFVQQKRLKLKERVDFYADEAKTRPLFSFRAEKVFDVHGRYFVEDAAGQPVGAFQKQFGKSLVNSTWHILDADGQPTLIIRESNQFLAAARRFAGFIPYVGDILELITLVFRYHFQFIDASGSSQEVGRYQKTTLFRDHYLLSMSDAAYQSHDWRVLAAMAVALDALQSR